MPANAVEDAKNLADVVLSHSGGHGCVGELYDVIQNVSSTQNYLSIINFEKLRTIQEEIKSSLIDKEFICEDTKTYELLKNIALNASLINHFIKEIFKSSNVKDFTDKKLEDNFEA